MLTGKLFIFIFFNFLCAFILVVDYPERIDLLFYGILVNCMFFGTIWLFRKGKQFELEAKMKR